MALRTGLSRLVRACNNPLRKRFCANMEIRRVDRYLAGLEYGFSLSSTKGLLGLALPSSHLIAAHLDFGVAMWRESVRMGTSEQRLPADLSRGATVSPGFLPVTGVTRKTEEPVNDSLRTVSWELVWKGLQRAEVLGTFAEPTQQD